MKYSINEIVYSVSKNGSIHKHKIISCDKARYICDNRFIYNEDEIFTHKEALTKSKQIFENKIAEIDKQLKAIV